MCSHPSAPDTTQQTNAQISAQQQTNEAQLAQQRAIADQQAAFNQQQLDYTKTQDTQRQAEADAAAQRQSIWDTSRNANATTGQQAVNDAFATFTPDYFQNYQAAQTNQGLGEIQRQADLARKGLTYNLARSGTLSSSVAADKQGLLAEDVGRQKVDYTNQAQDATEALQSNVLGQKQSLLSQVLGAQTLGSPVAGGNDASVSSNIDAMSRAVAGVGQSARDSATQIKPAAISSPLAGLFSSVIQGVGNYMTGNTAGQLAGAYGTGGPAARSALR